MQAMQLMAIARTILSGSRAIAEPATVFRRSLLS